MDDLDTILTKKRLTRETSDPKRIRATRAQWQRDLDTLYIHNCMSINYVYNTA